jgi:hypothetical protein
MCWRCLPGNGFDFLHKPQDNQSTATRKVGYQRPGGSKPISAKPCLHAKPASANRCDARTNLHRAARPQAEYVWQDEQTVTHYTAADPLSPNDDSETPHGWTTPRRGLLGTTAHWAPQRAQLAIRIDRDTQRTGRFDCASLGSLSPAERSAQDVSAAMVDRYATFATQHPAVAASRFESGRKGNASRFPYFFSALRKARASGY